MLQLLHALADALDAFHKLDPAGWFAWRGMLGRTGSAACILAGCFCLFIGAREGLFRFVAVPLGLILGVALTTPVLALTHGMAIPEKVVMLGVPGVLAVLSGIVPQTIAFVTLGTFGALLAAAIAPDADAFVAGVPAFLVTGIIGVVASRVVDTVASALFGALLVTAGALAAFPKSAAVELIISNAWGPTIVALLLAAAGGALQMVMHGDPDEVAARKAKAMDAKQREKDARERDARLARYGKS